MEETVVIETKLGKLRGKKIISALNNEKYYSFRGIPYGKPPIGKFRFKAPKPFEGWEGVRDALEDGHDPKQRILFRFPGMDPNKDTDGDEDCLYLCVYVKELSGKNSKKPVMVNIHGGGFVGGSGGYKAAGPDYFMGANIVFVSLNYRCGPFGFLSLENEEVPGNAGLKDQTLALQWVQQNIGSFGGDPSNVTIFGVSAGGASVHYHILSPLSKGLFHKAIIQSGFSQNPWALQQSPKKVALKLAKALNCSSEDPHEVLEFLQSTPSDDIIKATKEFTTDKEYFMLMGLVFSPCVEVAGPNKFLPDFPNNLMKSGDYNKVPTILGVCENEGSVFPLFTIINQLSFETILDAINNNPDFVLPPSFGLKFDRTDQKKIQEEVRDFYFKGKSLCLNDFDSLLKFEGDLLFYIGFGETRELLLENSSVPVYTYLFTNHSECYCRIFAAMQGPDNPASKFLSSERTCHGTDCMHLYRMTNGLPMPKLTGDFKESVSRHAKIWTTFALTGNPNVEELGVKWDQDSLCSPCYMDIGTAWCMREGVPFAERIEFWGRLNDKYSKQIQ